MNKLKQGEQPTEQETAVAAASQKPFNQRTDTLPAPLRQLIGRDEEVTVISDLIRQSRLLTLSGPGGVGKTTVALATARYLEQTAPELFPDGIHFVPLATCTNPAQVFSAMIEAIEIEGTTTTVSFDRLVNALRYQQVLLVLDNFEHLLAATPDIGELLQAAPALHIMVTSQALLNIYGEVEYPVRPLSVPHNGDQLSLETSQRQPSLALFCAVAQRTDARFALTSENLTAVSAICQQLDGLPLAIELAAARSKLFTPEQILSRLQSEPSFLVSRHQNIPNRHRTLQTAVQWSYDLLDETEQALFRRLALFADSFTVTAVASILLDQTEKAALDGLHSLVDKSMIYPALQSTKAETRFAMLSTLRHFAENQLHADPDYVNLRQRLVNYYVNLVQDAQNKWTVQEPVSGTELIHLEEHNIQAVLRLAFNEDDGRYAQQGASIIITLKYYWETTANYQEALSWIQQALEHRNHFETSTTISLLSAAGSFTAYISDDYTQSLALLEEAHALALPEDDMSLLNHTLNQLAIVSLMAGEHRKAEKYLKEALAYDREVHPTPNWERVRILVNLGITYKELKEFDKALALMQEGLAVAQEIDNPKHISQIIINLSNVARDQKNMQQSWNYLQEGLLLARSMKHQGVMIVGVSGAAEHYFLLSEWEMSIVLHSALQSISQAAGFLWPPAYQQEFTSYVNRCRQQLADVTYQEAWAKGSVLSITEAVDLILAQTMPG